MAHAATATEPYLDDPGELIGGKQFNHKVQWNGKTGNPMPP